MLILRALQQQGDTMLMTLDSAAWNLFSSFDMINNSEIIQDYHGTSQT